MKTIKYKIGKDEAISVIPTGSIIQNAKLVVEMDGEGLIYIPKNIRYEDDGEVQIDRSGVGSLSFGAFDRVFRYWVRSKSDWMNVTWKKYEPRRRKK